MLRSKQLAAQCAAMPGGRLASSYVAAALSRRECAAHMAALRRQMRRERRVQFVRNLAALWPIAVCLTISYYAPSLRDLAAGCAPWAATVLFSLSALAAQCEIHLHLAMAPTLSQAMLYAQFPLDGLVACVLLRRRSTWWSVCGEVAYLHVLAALCFVLVSGALGHLPVS